MAEVRQTAVRRHSGCRLEVKRAGPPLEFDSVAALQPRTIAASGAPPRDGAGLGREWLRLNDAPSCRAQMSNVADRLNVPVSATRIDAYTSDFMLRFIDSRLLLPV